MKILIKLMLIISFLAPYSGFTACPELEKIVNHIVFLSESKATIFEHPSFPGRKFRINVQDDIITPGLFKTAGGDVDEQFMAFVELLPINPNDKPYVVNIVTGLRKANDNSLHIEWVITPDYQKLLKTVKRMSSRLREGMSLFDALRLNVIMGVHDETHPVLKLLDPYLTHIFDSDEIPDEMLSGYFQTQDAIMPKSGVASAALEFIFKNSEIGTKIEFDIANKETVESLKSGSKWEETVLGKLLSRQGFSLVSISETPSEKSGFHTAQMTKSEQPQAKINWNP